MQNRKNAYTEVYTILQELNEEEYNKIPPEVIKAIAENRNKEYIFELDDELELEKHTLLPETKAILFNLFRDYLATPEQKEKIIRMQNEERQKNEAKKQQMYNSDMFSSRKKVIENKREQVSEEYVKEKNKEERLGIVEYKQSFINRIWNYIKSFFGRSNKLQRGK